MNPYDKNLFITSAYILTINDKRFVKSVRLGHSDTGRRVVIYGYAKKALVLDVFPSVNNRFLKKAEVVDEEERKQAESFSVSLIVGKTFTFPFLFSHVLNQSFVN